METILIELYISGFTDGKFILFRTSRLETELIRKFNHFLPFFLFLYLNQSINNEASRSFFLSL